MRGVWSLVIGQGCFQVRLLCFGRLSAGKSTDCYFEASCHSSNEVLVAVVIQLLSFLAELLPAHHMTSSASWVPSGQPLVLSGAW